MTRQFFLRTAYFRFLLQYFNVNHQQKELYVLWKPSFFLYHHPYIFPKNLESYEEKSYLCRRKAALGKLKASFLCAHLHFLCTE